MKFVAVTACPTEVAHTYMAAEALEMAAEELGHEIKVETQGSIGIENEITPEEIAAADAVIFAVDMSVTRSDRFAGKPILNKGVSEVIKHPQGGNFSLLLSWWRKEGNSRYREIAQNLGRRNQVRFPVKEEKGKKKKGRCCLDG